MAYLHSDREQFRDAIDLAYDQTGVMVQAIEKDYYVTMLLRLFTALVMIARPKAFAFALRNLHGVVMLYMFLICFLQVIPPKALAIHPPLALRN